MGNCRKCYHKGTKFFAVLLRVCMQILDSGLGTGVAVVE
jgi:hypothetical protein